MDLRMMVNQHRINFGINTPPNTGLIGLDLQRATVRANE